MLRSLTHTFFALTNKILALCGVELRRAHTLKNPARMSLLGMLFQFKKVDIIPATVFDIGAAFGDWSAEVATVFPSAHYELVEAVAEYQPIIEHETRSIKHRHTTIAAATEQLGTVAIHVHQDFVGSSLKTEFEDFNQKNSTLRKVPAVTIDSLTHKHNLKAPYFIKIDIQGAEIDALKGAQETLKKACGVLLEVSLIQAFKNGPILHDVITFMKSAGFVAYDLCNASYRPKDKALAQIDMMFVPESSQLIADKSFANEADRLKQDAKFKAIFAEYHRRATKTRA
jgi:FkbM family methyltransferase